MENIFNTIKSKVKTTKILAILGVVLIIFGAFFFVGKIKLDENLNNIGIKTEALLTDYWGGYVIIALAVIALALVYISSIKSKLPESAVNKIKFWDKLEMKKAIWVPAVLIIIILIGSWKTPIKNNFSESAKSSSLGSLIRIFGGDSNNFEESIDNYLDDDVEFKIGTGFIFTMLGSVSLIAYPILYKPEDEVQEAIPVSKEQDAPINE